MIATAIIGLADSRVLTEMPFNAGESAATPDRSNWARGERKMSSNLREENVLQSQRGKCPPISERKMSSNLREENVLGLMGPFPTNWIPSSFGQTPSNASSYFSSSPRVVHIGKSEIPGGVAQRVPGRAIVEFFTLFDSEFYSDN